MRIQRAKELWAAVNGDGCTSAPDFFYKKCCDDHDRHYTTGTHRDGSPITRAAADARLRTCMREAGKTPVLGRWVLPWVYWLGVRVFGRSHWGKNNDG